MLPFYLPSSFPVLCPDLCNSYLGYLSRWNIPQVGGGRGGEKSKTKCSCLDRILILYAWIALFNFFFFCTFFLYYNCSFPEPCVPGFRNPSCQHCLGLEAEGEVTMRQSPLPPLTPCPDLFSLGDPLHSPGACTPVGVRGEEHRPSDGASHVSLLIPCFLPTFQWCDPTSFVYLKIPLRVEMNL